MRRHIYEIFFTNYNCQTRSRMRTSSLYHIRELARIDSSIHYYLYFVSCIECLSWKVFLFIARARVMSFPARIYVLITHALNRNAKFCKKNFFFQFVTFLTRSVKYVSFYVMPCFSLNDYNACVK